jgi:hypothetical protein
MPRHVRALRRGARSVYSGGPSFRGIPCDVGCDRAPGCECWFPEPPARGGVPSATLATLRPLAAGSARRDFFLAPQAASSTPPHRLGSSGRRHPRNGARHGWSSRGRGIRAELSGREVKRRLAGASQVERRSEEPPPRMRSEARARSLPIPLDAIHRGHLLIHLRDAGEECPRPALRGTPRCAPGPPVAGISPWGNPGGRKGAGCGFAPGVPLPRSLCRRTRPPFVGKGPSRGGRRV